MSALDSLHGNAPTIESLKAALAAGRLPHAVLLCAPDGCGRNFAARCLAADYLYPNGGPAAEAVLRGEGSEVLTVAGEGKSGQIPIDRIRAVRRDIFYSALSAAGRVVHIRDAHNMAAPAANALLKVLEEPPADALFILTAQSPASLPATITSRCALFTLAPLDVAECTALIVGLCKASGGQTSSPSSLREDPGALPPGTDSSLAPLLATLYGGRYGMALAALRDEGRLATVRDAMQATQSAAARNTYALLQLFAGYEGRADGDRARRDALLSDMTDALEASLRGSTVPGLPAFPPEAAALLLPPIAQARGALRGNAAPKITFAALAIQLAGAGLG